MSLPPDERSARNAFAGHDLDRAAERREQPGWLAAARADGRLVVVDFEGRTPVDADGALLALPATALDPDVPASFLGLRDGVAWFAAPADALPDVRRAALEHWCDLRGAALRWASFESGLFAYAKALLLWQARARFCNRCGRPTELRRAGHAAHCAPGGCGLEQYPRTDPAVIVIVHDHERCLLGRQAGWPEGRWSTLAGFVEPGESLEDAARREVLEEAGVRLGVLRYHSSQPWPFPGSLMLGFSAEAASTAIVLGDELQDARWFEVGELRDAVLQGRMTLPPPISVSFHLIRDWMAQRLGCAPEAVFPR